MNCPYKVIQVFVCLLLKADLVSVTENGVHYGVEVFGLVFDNLSIYGLPRNEWIGDFDCPSGQFRVDELEKLGD